MRVQAYRIDNVRMSDIVSATSRPDPEPLAEIRVRQPVTVVVPTYREAENIPIFIERLDALRRRNDLTLEILFMDDDSGDGSAELVAASGFDWVKLITRTEDRGLSEAVVDGMRRARYPILVCMDCDLSHPPEKIPQMLLALSAGLQMVIGSRYVTGGTTDDNWGYLRYFVSTVATLLARPLTAVSDPMSGFFVLRREDFVRARDLNPVGYKIALELIVKCGFDNVGEVPIHFVNRVRGESKLTLREQLKYIKHLRRLYAYKFTNTMYFLQFLVVGAIGTVVNLAVLTMLSGFGSPKTLALGGGIVTSLISNFLLNRRFTFSHARHENLWRQFAGFVSASLIGMVLNYAVALTLASGPLADRPFGLQIAALAGIAAGLLFNFVGSRYFVFRKRHVTARQR
ncbi:MAG: glycosyltransferase family 2 protein [Hyphomicrobiales bacterium]|nr:glycosyltransferase family 2 protein [Hyphomicrobiales bacterium]